jgi:hypothetical protein
MMLSIQVRLGTAAALGADCTPKADSDKGFGLVVSLHSQTGAGTVALPSSAFIIGVGLATKVPAHDRAHDAASWAGDGTGGMERVGESFARLP